MTNLELLDRLVEIWRAQWILDEEVTPEMICREHPELLTQVQREVERIKILDELLGKYEAQRAAGQNPTLERICRDHPDYIDRLKTEIRKLKLFDGVCGKDTDAEPSRDEQVGRFCDGRYDVQAVINQGGQGIIYIAQDKELGRTVVVKGPGKRGLDRESLGRLELEARTTGRLEHPGVVPVYGFGRDPSGKPYYAMKFIDGETLSAAIKRFHGAQETGSESGARTVEFQKLLRDFVLVCQAIAFAHSRDIVHRDIKPINIMLGKFGEVWVVDWGLAKRMPPSGNPPASERPIPKSDGSANVLPSNFAAADTLALGESVADEPPDGHLSEELPTTRLVADEPPGAGFAADKTAAEAAPTWRGAWLSQTFSIKGTLMYMSPEQAEGRNNEVGPPSDIYSLGATLYELLTNQPPVKGSSPQEILQRVIAGQVAAPRETRPDVAPALDAICRKSMSRIPADRYATAAELADDIERWLADEPVSAWPEPLSAQAGRWIKRHRTIVAGAVAALMVGLVGMGLLAAQQAWAKGVVVAAKQKLDDTIEEVNDANTKLQVANEREREAAEKARLSEQKAKKLAEAERLEKEKTRRLLYFSRIGQAHSEWLADRVGLSKKLLLDCDQDLRGWEWGFVDLLAKAVIEFRANGNASCIACSKNEGILAVGNSDGEIAVWSELFKPSEHLRIPKILSFHPEGRIGYWSLDVVRVAVSPRGNLIAAASHKTPFGLAKVQSEVRIWEATGKQVFSLPVEATGLEFSPDGKSLALATGTALELWDVATQKRVRSFPVSTAPGRSVAFSADGRYLASGGWDGTLKVWNLITEQDPGEELSQEGQSKSALGLALSADGQRLAVGSLAGEIDLWNLKAWREKIRTEPILTSLQGHNGAVRSVAFHPQQPTLASGSDDRTIKLWSSESGQEIQTLRGHEERIAGVVFSPDGQQVVSADQNGVVRLWNPQEYQESKTRKGQTAAVSGDGRFVATTAPSGPNPRTKDSQTVWVWDAPTGKPVREFSGHKGKVECVALRSDGKLAASGGGNGREDGEAIVWEVETGQVVWKLEVTKQSVKRLAFSPDGKTLASADSEHDLKTGQLRLWSLETGLLLMTAGIVQGAPTSLAFSANGKLLVVATRNGPVRLLDVQTGRDVLRLADRNYFSAAFSPQGDLLATTGGDFLDAGKVWIWQVETGQLAYEFSGHSDLITAVAFSHDGSRMATGSYDRTLRLWDAATRQEILALSHPGGVNALAFSANGEILISSSGIHERAGFTKIWKAKAHDPPE